jgi:hypothetical protein
MRLKPNMKKLLCLHIPKSGLALVSLLSNSRSTLTRGWTLEWGGRGVCLSSHGSVSGSWSARSRSGCVSRWVLVLERIEVLKGHFELDSDAGKNTIDRAGCKSVLA